MRMKSDKQASTGVLALSMPTRTLPIYSLMKPRMEHRRWIMGARTLTYFCGSSENEAFDLVHRSCTQTLPYIE